MNASRALATGAAVALTFGLAAGLAPAAFADDTVGTTCSATERQTLRAEIADLHAQIADLRLSADEIAAKKTEHRKAVDALRAEYGLPGATLTDAQRAELKAKIDELKAKERQDAADRRSTIDPLKAKIAADRQQLRACRAPATS